MKKIFILLIGIFLFAANLTAQIVFRSIAAGDYNTATTWEKSSNGGTSYYPNDGTDGLGTGSGKTYPGSSTDAIIVSPHIVTFAATSNAKNLTINSGATLKSTTASP